jgi:hypothetical protein
MRSVSALAALLGVFAIGHLAKAEDTAERQAIQATSHARVLAASVVPALERKAGPGNSSRLNAVLGVLPALARLDGKAEQRDSGEVISLASSAGWFLTISSNGDHFDYRDDELANASPWEQAPAMPLDELVAEGKKVVEGPLSALLALGPMEKLVPIHASREVRGIRDNSGTLLAETVAVNIIEFARTIGDIPVLGRGSRVRVGFSPRGELVSIDADWPRLESLKERRFAVASPEVVSARESALFSWMGIPGSAALTRFECGYLDNGGSALLQPGCRVNVRYEQGGATMARSFSVPAAEAPASDPSFAEIDQLSQGGVL